MNNNPNNWPETHFKAYLSHYNKFGTYVAVYEDAVTSLYKRVSEGRDTPDMVCFPLLFLMRHTLELGYKYSIYHLSCFNGTNFMPEGKGQEGHRLQKLHERLKTEYDLAFQMGVFRDRDQDTFNDYYAYTEASMNRFDILDIRSTKLRYPNSDETGTFEAETIVNLLELKDEFDKAMTLLNTMADVLESRRSKGKEPLS